MSGLEQLLEGYVIGDRMGSLEEGLEDAVRLDCGQADYAAAGPILWSNGTHMSIDPGQSHTLVISSTGGGKTVSEIMPMLRASIKAGESLFITDTKSGELYDSAWPYLKQKGYRTYVVDMRQPLRGLRYNPLDLPARLLCSPEPSAQAVGYTLMLQAAEEMMIQEKSTSDPFWDNAARDTFLGLIYFLIYLTQGEGCHIQGVWDLFRQIKDNTRTWASFFSTPDSMKSDLLRSAQMLLQTRFFSSDSPKTASSIDSTLNAKFTRLLASPLQVDLLCGNDIDFQALDQERTAIFLLLPDETQSWNAHASLLVSQVYQYLCLLCSTRYDGSLPHRFHFILEEFGNLSLGETVGSLFSAGRSRNIRVTAVIQNFSQLTTRYGKELGDTIRYNCGNWIYLYSRDMETLKTLSELCGSRTYLQQNLTRNVASISDLQTLSQGQALIFRTRRRPFLTDLAPIWAYPETAKAEKPSRSPRELSLPPRLDYFCLLKNKLQPDPSRHE